MNRLIIGSFLLLLTAFSVFAQATANTVEAGTSATAAVPQPNEEKKQTPKDSDQKSFHLDFGGFYNAFIPWEGSNNWRGWDARLLYSGFKGVTPFGGVSRINNGNGGQNSYGIGSYITFNRWFYIIGGASFAPTSKAEFSPHRRYDIAGMFTVPKIKGMVFSTALTVLPEYGNAGAGRIIAIGNIYYWRKFIFGGNLNISIAQPGNSRSVSGQFSTTYGSRGNFYLAGGLSGGGAGYMLITGTPFEVRYQTMSGYVMLTKWVAKHVELNCRYSYDTIIDSSFMRHSIRIGTSYEF